MDLKYLVQNKEKIDELLSQLDAIAKDVDSYEYGLPMYDENVKARMREALYMWACSELPTNVEVRGCATAEQSNGETHNVEVRGRPLLA